MIQPAYGEFYERQDAMAKLTTHEQYRALTAREREIVDAFRTTWETIRLDVLKLYSTKRAARRTVVEHVEHFVEMYGHGNPEKAKLVAARAMKLSETDLARLGKIAFPADHYTL